MGRLSIEKLRKHDEMGNHFFYPQSRECITCYRIIPMGIIYATLKEGKKLKLTIEKEGMNEIIFEGIKET